MTGKTFGRHQTIHTSLKREIEAIRKISGVDRVIIGPSKGCRHNRPVGSMRVQTNVATAVRLLGYSDRGVSEFFVITSDLTGVRDQLTDRYGE